MVGFMEVFSRMFVFGGITASYVSAFQAQPQVDPGVSGLDAVFADMLVSISGFGFLNVSAVVHVFPACPLHCCCSKLYPLPRFSPAAEGPSTPLCAKPAHSGDSGGCAPYRFYRLVAYATSAAARSRVSRSHFPNVAAAS